MNSGAIFNERAPVVIESVKLLRLIALSMVNELREAVFKSNNMCVSCGSREAALLRLFKLPEIAVLVPVTIFDPPYTVKSCISNEALAPEKLTVVA